MGNMPDDQKAPDMDKGWLIDDITINKNILHFETKDKKNYSKFFNEKRLSISLLMTGLNT